MTKPDYIEALEFALGVEAFWGHHHYTTYAYQTAIQEGWYPAGHDGCKRQRYSKWVVNGESVSFETQEQKDHLAMEMLRKMAKRGLHVSLEGTYNIGEGPFWVVDVYKDANETDVEREWSFRDLTAPEAVMKSVLAVKESE